MLAVTRVDPNWLLSTTARSSAALVGIIGGLLVTRLVALSNERSGLERQRQEAHDVRNSLQEQLDVLEGEFRELAEQAFVLRAADDAIEKRNTITPEILVRDHHAPSRYLTEIDELYLANRLVESHVGA
jgi:hypothetical protein